MWRNEPGRDWSELSARWAVETEYREPVPTGRVAKGVAALGEWIVDGHVLQTPLDVENPRLLTEFDALNAVMVAHAHREIAANEFSVTTLRLEIWEEADVDAVTLTSRALEALAADQFELHVLGTPVEHDLDRERQREATVTPGQWFHGLDHEGFAWRVHRPVADAEREDVFGDPRFFGFDRRVWAQGAPAAAGAATLHVTLVPMRAPTEAQPSGVGIDWLLSATDIADAARPGTRLSIEVESPR